MKFGKYLDRNKRPEWGPYYISYEALKDLINLSSAETERALTGEDTQPRETSLSVVRTAGRQESAEERFFKRLEAEVSKVGKFTEELVSQLRAKMSRMQSESATLLGKDGTHDAALKAKLLEEAKKFGDEFLALEKYVNLNYMGFHKILKKHGTWNFISTAGVLNPSNT
jgi:SPX domain protein involved in polyphosphate accumulation